LPVKPSLASVMADDGEAWLPVKPSLASVMADDGGAYVLLPC
jgi:hypothetical protein